MKHLIRSTVAALCLVSAAFVAPALAHAAEGYVTGNVNLRAGPDTGYPLINVIPAGTSIDVRGCTEGWEWCDVVVYGDRGWVVGNYVEYVYQSRPVLLPAYGARIGIPIITFTIGNYWDSYYRNRPFYGRRDYWYHRPVVRRPPPPPMRHPYRPPAHGAPGHGTPRPMPSRPTPSRPTGPGHTTRPPATRPPATGHRPPPNMHPQPVVRPGNNRPAPAAGHAQPVRSQGQAKPHPQGNSKPADRKNDHRGH